MTGTTVLHYRIRERLGGGGMGEVYLAEDTRLGRQVALKFLPPAVAADRESRARLLNEARAASALHSPHIAVTYDIAEHAGSMFIVMEYVRAELVSDRIAHGPLSPRDAVSIALQVTDALDEAHARGIIHGDIKSANLMVTGRGLVKVLDFGVARFLETGGDGEETRTQITMSGIIAGTVSYMSPEQALGRPIDSRSDIFSTGVVLFEMLTGCLPFQGRAITEVIDRLVHERQPAPSQLNPSVSADLDRIVARAMEKNPADRHQSAHELNIDLQGVRRRLEGVSEDLEHAPGDQQGADAGRHNTVAVMTFANITGTPEDDWIGTGIAETVTADLKSVKGLAVIARAQISDALKGLAPGERARAEERIGMEVGRRLGAKWVVSGGYQRLGPQIRITAQFMDAGTGALVSTVKVDGRIDEIFVLQDKIVFDLTERLNLRLGIGEMADIERDETRSVEAYEAYSRGLMNLRLSGRDSIDRAILLFERALEHDPSYASAWASLGAAYELKGSFLSVPEMLEKAIACERRAISLDPRLANAYLWLGSALRDTGRIDEAIAAVREALALEPDSAAAHAALARSYWLGKGQIEEAIGEFERAVEINPEAGYSYLQLCLLYAFRGRYSDAERAGRVAVDLQKHFLSGKEGLQVAGAHARLGYVYYLQGRYEEAIHEYERELAFISSGDHALGERTTIEVEQKLGAAYLRRELREEAEAHFSHAVKAFAGRLARGADDPYTRYYMGCLHALRSETDRALEHLERSFVELAAINRVRAPIDPDLESLRDVPRFRELL